MWIAVGVGAGMLVGGGLVYAIIAGKFGNAMRGRAGEPWWTYWT